MNIGKLHEALQFEAPVLGFTSETPVDEIAGRESEERAALFLGFSTSSQAGAQDLWGSAFKGFRAPVSG